jgi:hypothetical protein
METRNYVEQNEPSPESSGRNLRRYGGGASAASAAKTEHIHQTEDLIEAVVERQNMIKALAQVKRNKGVGGVDGVTVYELDTYVGSKAAGERVLERITRFLERKLRLTVNAAKSAVDRPWKRKFLGYSMTMETSARLKPSSQNIQRLKDSIREQLRRGRGRRIDRVIYDLTLKLRGWGNYFKLSEVKLIFEDLDSWIRRKLRNMIWRQWKKPSTRCRELKSRGIPDDLARQTARSGRGPWFASGTKGMNFAFPKKFFDDHGLVSLFDMRQSR